uniref:Uncharacterized protein n=1 Tax=Romanomermis culicivorax TaxID=13658 RepID=A0A915JB02_ROMCU
MECNRRNLSKRKTNFRSVRLEATVGRFPKNCSYPFRPKTLQDEIDKQGRILLEACRKDLFGSPTCPTLEAITNRNLELADEKSGTLATGPYEKKKRIFCSLENRWKRLRLQALECSVRLDAFLRHDQNQFLRPNSSVSTYEPPNKKSRANNDSTLLLANELLIMKSSTPKEVVENKHSKLAEWNIIVPLYNDASPVIDADLDYKLVMNDSDDFNVDLADNPVCKYANSCDAKCSSYEMLEKDRTAPVATNSLDLPGISSAMNSSETSDSLVDNGYSSGENHLPHFSGKDCDEVPKCRQIDQKLNSISLADDYSYKIENSPVRDYYKMLPDEDMLLLENPGTIISEKTSNWFENFSCTRADWESNGKNAERTTAKNDDHKQSISAEMTDSMVVNVSHSKENLAQENLSQILSMMDESCDEFPHKVDYANRLAITLDEKMRELFNYNRGTTWRSFAGTSLTNRSSLKVRTDSLKKARDSEDDRTSNDAGSELSTEEENHNIQFNKILSIQKSPDLVKHVRSKKRSLDDRMHSKRCQHAIDTLKRYADKIKENNMIVDPLMLKSVEDLMISWENELNRHHQADPYADVDSIKDSIKQLAGSLQCFQEKLLNSSGDDPESSIEETLKKIEELKELRNKILTARKKLNSFERCPDLANLDACCQDASDKCEVELRSLEELKNVLQDWKDNENDFRDLSFRLRERLADCGSFDSLLDGSSSFCSSRDPERSNDNFDDFKAIRDDIKRCEERLERLENVYNKLAKVQSNELTLKDDLLDECRRQLDEYRKHISTCIYCNKVAKQSVIGRFFGKTSADAYASISLPSLSKNEQELKNDLNKSRREEQEDIFVVKQELKDSTKMAKKRRKSREKEAQIADIVEKQHKLQPEK